MTSFIAVYIEIHGSTYIQIIVWGEGLPRIDNMCPPIIIDRVTPRSRKRGPEYCLPAEHLNPVQKNPQEILVFCTLGPPSTWDSRGAPYLHHNIVYARKKCRCYMEFSLRSLLLRPFCGVIWCVHKEYSTSAINCYGRRLQYCAIWRRCNW
jgi:hypothetical protein